ncbi:NADH-quinone oxidoreductase subunit C [Tautonia plasticadhaerens]|uniref:NADH-quinone oxidoreductase subunit C n=1 Tax=Tautonia plasticadhaerens TaxID=2527974 RepID=A0A518H8R5_9BACT|nr:NADH-quinone oxidoreductase subunit C [Tautonia plasticadhaerens]QDV37156.1 NADH-quinone oxidoreductase subunit C 1 [Tautonia plasticadhaerens]
MTENDAETLPPVVGQLKDRFGSAISTVSTFRDNVRVLVDRSRLADLLAMLKAESGFGLLAELGGVDYLGYPGRDREFRFEVHYVLLNQETHERVIIKVGVDADDPVLPSAVPIWRGADWMEREIFDMYGIRFQGHPDLRRILMPDEFTAFPLRKDYPLRGRGERHNFPRITREQS